MSARLGGGVCSAAGGVAGPHCLGSRHQGSTARSSDMDDLDGLFSAASPATVSAPAPAPGFPAPPVAQLQFPGQQQVAAPVPAPGFGLPPAMAQLPGQQAGLGEAMTPTQTTAASQLNNKSQIMGQFHTPPPTPQMGPVPPRPAPVLPGQMQQQFVSPPQQQQQPPQPQQLGGGAGAGLLASVSVTEPMPSEFDSMFAAPLSSGAADTVDGDLAGAGQGGAVAEEKAEEAEVKEEEVKEAAAEPERKVSFWSGLWNRSKDHGSKENILEEAGGDKKDGDDGERVISISSLIQQSSTLALSRLESVGSGGGGVRPPLAAGLWPGSAIFLAGWWRVRPREDRWPASSADPRHNIAAHQHWPQSPPHSSQPSCGSSCHDTETPSCYSCLRLTAFLPLLGNREMHSISSTLSRRRNYQFKCEPLHIYFTL